MKGISKKLFLPALISLGSQYNVVIGQEIDSIAFHLYTDSLKKGVHNYINVDGFLREGRWIPLTAKDLNYTSSSGRFDGNNLVIDSAFTGEKIIVTVIYNRNKNLTATTAIYLKKNFDSEFLPTTAEILQQPASEKKSRRKKKSNH